jgi:hypothetical protein
MTLEEEDTGGRGSYTIATNSVTNKHEREGGNGNG